MFVLYEWNELDERLTPSRDRFLAGNDSAGLLLKLKQEIVELLALTLVLKTLEGEHGLLDKRLIDERGLADPSSAENHGEVRPRLGVELLQSLKLGFAPYERLGLNGGQNVLLKAYSHVTLGGFFFDFNDFSSRSSLKIVLGRKLCEHDFIFSYTV